MSNSADSHPRGPRTHSVEGRTGSREAPQNRGSVWAVLAIQTTGQNSKVRIHIKCEAFSVKSTS